jgi:hypothetical protein
LFVEVISAPTADALKKESSSRLGSSALGRVFHGAKDAVRKMSVVSKNTLSQFRKGSKSRSDDWTDIITTTRVVPPRTKEAHDEAIDCAQDVIETAKSRQERRSSLMKSRHDEFARSQSQKAEGRHRKSTRDSKIKHGKQTPISPVSRSRSRLSWLAKKGHNVTEVVDVDPLFEQLTHDINAQRKLLKRSQQDGFDFLWGYSALDLFLCSCFLLLSCLSPVCACVCFSVCSTGSTPQANSLANDNCRVCFGLT